MVVVEGVRLWGVLGLGIAGGAQANLDLPLKIKRGRSCDFGDQDHEHLFL